MRGTDAANKEYYNAFSKGYENQRDGRAANGYHDLLDELESGFVRKYGAGKDVLEVGCGTGLVLRHIAQFAKSAKGVDLSPGMLEHAKARGLDVEEASATELPFKDESFDVVCSFKVLAHVPEITKALTEMARVTRPGGWILAEFYNPSSVRGLVKRFGPRGLIAPGVDEGVVYTRFDSRKDIERYTPPGCRLADERGVRIFTPAAKAMSIPGVGTALNWAERTFCDGPMARYGGFYIAAFKKS